MPLRCDGAGFGFGCRDMDWTVDSQESADDLERAITKFMVQYDDIQWRTRQWIWDPSSD